MRCRRTPCWTSRRRCWRSRFAASLAVRPGCGADSRRPDERGCADHCRARRPGGGRSPAGRRVRHALVSAEVALRCCCWSPRGCSDAHIALAAAGTSRLRACRRRGAERVAPGLRIVRRGLAEASSSIRRFSASRRCSGVTSAGAINHLPDCGRPLDVPGIWSRDNPCLVLGRNRAPRTELITPGYF